MSPGNKSVKRLVELKSKFDQSLERLLHKLNELNLSMVNNSINNSTKEEKEKMEEYFACLQMELSRKITDLVEFQGGLNSHCSRVFKLNKFTVFSESPQDDALDGDDTKFTPDQRFLSRPLSKHQLTTGTDSITNQEVKELKAYLDSRRALPPTANQ